MPMAGRHIFGSGDSAGCFHRMGAVGCHRDCSVAARGHRVADSLIFGRHGGGVCR